MTSTSRTLLIVDDSPEDQELYRRYLQRHSDCTYTILDATLGKQGLHLWQQHQPDAVLLDYRLPDLDGLEFLAQLHSFSDQQCLPVIMVTGQGNEAIAVQAMKAGAQDYLVKEQITPEGLQLTVNSVIETVQLRIQLHQRVERERLVADITRKIHQSLDLDEILQTTVTEVRQFLQTDRVLIFRLQTAGWGTVITESVGAGWPALLDTSYYDPCLSEKYVEPFHQGHITIKPDIYDGSIDPCHVELLAGLQVRANLVVPILQHNQLWGMLIAHHCNGPRHWQSIEIDLLKELATQAGIALQQAELYQQAQNELAERKQAELERDRLLQCEQSARVEAERANRIKDEFLAILSHELRSPLNPILGWTKLLQLGTLSPAQTTEALETIERNVKLQTQLIDDLLDIAKILRGKLTLQIAPVNLVFVIEAAMETVKAAALAKNIHLHATLSPVGNLSGDVVRLQQVVWNLLSNAIKFTSPGGSVEIHLSRTTPPPPPHSPAPHSPVPLPPCSPPPFYAQITVIDTGKGINPNFLPHIFESFRQEDASTTRKFGGLGLGLAIVRQIVEAHGGTIAAHSIGEGLGATFTVCLPLLAVAPEAQCGPELDAQEADLTGVRILVVDDEPDSLELMEVILTQYGAETRAVASAVEALAALSSFKPDLLVSDIGMPNIDGYSLIRQIRGLPAKQGGQIPAIALTAYAREEDRQRAIASGFQRHTVKPLDPEVFVQQVKQLIGR